MSANAKHSPENPKKTAILLVNLGSPDEPTPAAVRRYLAEFLHDKRVVDLSRWLWCPILHGIILRTRPAKTAHAYQSIWQDDGSPLVVTTQKQAALLRQRFAADNIDVQVAMRYGNPSIGAALDKLQHKGVQRLLVLPLYPQYSRTTTESVRDKLLQEMNRQKSDFNIDFIEYYFDNPLYIAALAESIRTFQAKHERPQKLIFSYHGIPQRYAENGDIYPKHCRQTTERVAQALGLSTQDYIMTFQSRFGREEWLKPYTDETLIQLAQNGVRIVHVISPAFAADCLETLEELEVENRGYFETAGETDPDNTAARVYRYIPALNEQLQHIDVFESIIRRRLGLAHRDPESA